MKKEINELHKQFTNRMLTEEEAYSRLKRLVLQNLDSVELKSGLTVRKKVFQAINNGFEQSIINLRELL